MKRIHINIGVKELDPSIAFYTALFGAAPGVVKDDYAKWSLDSPAVNFALSSCCGDSGIHHLGIQTEQDSELDEVLERMSAAGHGTEIQRDVSCCYAVSDKSWIDDPQGVRWEAFRTHQADTGQKCSA
jgi:catechol 2,3-dioxygenase-like lactoylglutathione lyase family enzyme